MDARLKKLKKLKKLEKFIELVVCTECGTVFSKAILGKQMEDENGRIEIYKNYIITCPVCHIWEYVDANW